MPKENTIEFWQFIEDDSEKLVMMPYCQEDINSHDHHFFELVYITGGTARHTLEEKPHILTSGDYFLVDYGSRHSYGESRGLTLINCLFLPEVVDDTLQGCHSFDVLLQSCLIKYYRMSPGKTGVNRIFHDGDGRILQLMEGMQMEYEQKKVGYARILRGRLLEILLLTLRELIPEEKKRPESSAVLEVLAFVDRGYQNAVTLRAFCDEKHYSVPYISRRFRQETGMTVREYLQKVRIEKSCMLLADSDMRISEIAQAVGYEDIRFFNQVFKRMMKMPPRDYRKLCLRKGE